MSAPRKPEVEEKKPEVADADRILLAAAAAPPLAWLSQLAFGMGAARWLCAIGSRGPFYVASGLSLFVAFAGIATCAAALRWQHARRAGRAPGEARRAIAWAGVGLGGFFVLLVFATIVPGLVLEPCQ